MHYSVVRIVFAKMVNWRSILVKVNNRWNNLRRSVQPYLDCDYDRCLDLIKIGAGIRPLAGDEPWKRNCLNLYWLLGCYQLIMGMAKVGFSIRKGNDTLEICASYTLLVTQIAILAKVYILGYYDEAVQQSRNFVHSNCNHSRDPDYDAMVRRDHARVSGKVTLGIFVILCCDQVIFSIPSSARDSIYGIPEQFHVLGAMAARLLQETYVFMFGIFWGCGYFISPLTVMPRLNGLKHELLIIARGYETIAQRGQAQAWDDQNYMTGTSQTHSISVLMPKHLKKKLEIAVNQHVEVLRIIHLMQPLVSHLYAIIHYSVMIIVSLLIFVVIRSEITLVTLVVFGVTGIFFVVECYLWCHMIESIEETMETIADCVAPLAFELQHSVDNHSEYIEMRTSIMIILLNTSQIEWFSCGGVFPISVESFGNLCMIIYKFTTFLLNFE